MLIGIADTFENIRILSILSLSISACRDRLLTMKQPVSMMLYKILLQEEGVPEKEAIDRLYEFTYVSSHIPSAIVNDYLFFA